MLASIPAAERAALSNNAEHVELAQGYLAAGPREPFTHIYFPVNSAFSFVTDLRDGDSVECGTVGNEGFAGIPVFLGGAAWAQRAIVQMPGAAWKIPAEEFLRLIPVLPGLSAAMQRYVLAYVSQISQTSACNSQHTIIQRCARWILLSHDRVGSNTIPLTQEFLSYMLGVRRPSVTSAQTELQQLGVIEYSRGKIGIVDREGLEAACCECYFVVRDEFTKLLGVSVG